MAELAKLLTVTEVADILGIGENAAYEVMKTMAHVRIGRRIRVRPDVLDKWIRKGGETWQKESAEIGCISEGTSGGAGDTTTRASAGESPLTSVTTKRLSLCSDNSNGKRLLLPISRKGPRKQTSRSSKRSSGI